MIWLFCFIRIYVMSIASCLTYIAEYIYGAEPAGTLSQRLLPGEAMPTCRQCNVVGHENEAQLAEVSHLVLKHVLYS